MTNQVKHCFNLNRCDMIINLYHNFEMLRMRVEKQCDNNCLSFFDTVKKDIYDLTLPELNEYPKNAELKKNKRMTKEACDA